MKILLDTNFILTCAKQKIDFIILTNKLSTEKIDFVLPIEVESELKNLSQRKGEKVKDRDAAKISLELTANLDKIPLGTKNTDQGIIKYAKNDPKVIIATMDKELKQNFENKILTIRGKNNLGII